MLSISIYQCVYSQFGFLCEETVHKCMHIAWRFSADVCNYNINTIWDVYYVTVVSPTQNLSWHYIMLLKHTSLSSADTLLVYKGIWVLWIYQNEMCDAQPKEYKTHRSIMSFYFSSLFKYVESIYTTSRYTKCEKVNKKCVPMCVFYVHLFLHQTKCG